MAKNNVFRFKQFSIDHSGAAMKVGTDAVLLGAWAKVEGAGRLLDIGTGSGVIALMLAQRTLPQAIIDAVEVAADDARQACENINASPWPKKVRVHVSDIRHFTTEYLYDVIVSNPPFFINSLEPPREDRHRARHTGSLPQADLAAAVSRLLSPGGSFNVILPPNEAALFIGEARKHHLYCSRGCAFLSRRGRTPERHLLEFTRTEVSKEETQLVLYRDGIEWTDEYRALTSDFYLRAGA